MASQDEAFEKVMELVGDAGPFQNRFNGIYNFGMIFAGAMLYMNVILAMSTPEHWCYVPGREHTNYTVEEWKALTLPRYEL